MTLQSIYNYKEFSINLATGGQPDENQLHCVIASGFEAVVNLGISNADYAIPNEETLLKHRGVDYFHIPVDFANPEPHCYFEFAQLFRELKNRKVFVHCAANKRASIFIALFNVLENGIPVEKAWTDILTIWEPNQVWRDFFYLVLGYGHEC